MKMTFYTANCRGNAKNSLYPNRRVIDNEDDCMEVVAFDHVCAEFKGCRRSGDNFLSCDVDVMDCDNSHSDNPADWIHPEDLEGKIGKDVAFVVVPSRNNMKPKEGKSARPRFHVYFPHDPITDGDVCASLKKAIQQKFPFFDAKALDSARFIFGHPADSILWHEGEITIDCIVKPQGGREIPQGQRNATMSHFAGRVVKRYGATEKAHEIFLEEANKCNPPLEIGIKCCLNQKRGERMKRYFMQYESDQKVCGDYNHIYGFASVLKTAKGYIRRCRKTDAEHNPRNFRIYDTWGECSENEHVPCVYMED